MPEKKQFTVTKRPTNEICFSKNAVRYQIAIALTIVTLQKIKFNLDTIADLLNSDFVILITFCKKFQSAFDLQKLTH